VKNNTVHTVLDAPIVIVFFMSKNEELLEEKVVALV
jgi:hypothetical protein